MRLDVLLADDSRARRPLHARAPLPELPMDALLDVLMLDAVGKLGVQPVDAVDDHPHHQARRRHYHRHRDPDHRPVELYRRMQPAINEAAWCRSWTSLVVTVLGEGS
jgi:hypothetical protein